MKTEWLRARAVALVCALALGVLSGCGQTEASDGGERPPETSPTPKVTEKVTADPMEQFESVDVLSTAQRVAALSVRIVRSTRHVGTGFFVGADSLFLTNAHVLNGNPEDDRGNDACAKEGCWIEIGDLDGATTKTTRVFAEPVRYASVESLDVIALRLWYSDAKVVRYGPTKGLAWCEVNASVGDKVALVGHPAGGHRHATRGELLPVEPKVAANYWHGRMAAYAGMSGGPLLAASGCVAGQVSVAANFDRPEVTVEKRGAFGSTASALKGVLEGPAPAFASVDAPVKASEAAYRDSFYFMAGKNTFLSEETGKRHRIDELLAVVCDTGLKVVEEKNILLKEVEQICTSIVKWDDHGRANREFPQRFSLDRQERAEWLARFRKLSDLLSERKMVDLAMDVGMLQTLYMDRGNAADHFAELVRTYRPPFSFGIGVLALQHTEDPRRAEIDGTAVVKSFVEYEKRKDYAKEGTALVRGLVLLFRAGLLGPDKRANHTALAQKLSVLKADRKLPLGDRFLVEVYGSQLESIAIGALPVPTDGKANRSAIATLLREADVAL